MHVRGIGGDINYAEAIRLYEQAIELGNTDAMNNRARMLDDSTASEPKPEVVVHDESMNQNNRFQPMKVQEYSIFKNQNFNLKLTGFIAGASIMSTILAVSSNSIKYVSGVFNFMPQFAAILTTVIISAIAMALILIAIRTLFISIKNLNIKTDDFYTNTINLH